MRTHAQNLKLAKEEMKDVKKQLFTCIPGLNEELKLLAKFRLICSSPRVTAVSSKYLSVSMLLKIIRDPWEVVAAEGMCSRRGQKDEGEEGGAEWKVKIKGIINYGGK